MAFRQGHRRAHAPAEVDPKGTHELAPMDSGGKYVPTQAVGASLVLVPLIHQKEAPIPALTPAPQVHWGNEPGPLGQGRVSP